MVGGRTSRWRLTGSFERAAVNAGHGVFGGFAYHLSEGFLANLTHGDGYISIYHVSLLMVVLSFLFVAVAKWEKVNGGCLVMGASGQLPMSRQGKKDASVITIMAEKEQLNICLFTPLLSYISIKSIIYIHFTFPTLPS